MDALVELTSRLVAIDSINPGLVPGGAGEAERGAIRGRLARGRRARGRAHRARARQAERRRARARQRAEGRTLLLNAHMDTVGVAGVERPFDAARSRRSAARPWRRRHEGARWPRSCSRARSASGSGSAATSSSPRVADEELGSIGTEALVASVTADAAIVAEPTDERVAVAHKGFVGVRGRGDGPCRTRVAARSRDRRDRGDGAGADPDHRARRAPARGGGASVARYGIGARLADRGWPGVLELSRPLPPDG